MNYYHRPGKKRHRRPQKKSFIEYIAPLLIIIVFISAGIFIYQKMTNKDETTQENGALANIEEKAKLKINEGDIKILLRGMEKWQSAKDEIDLFEGDAIKSSSGAKGKIYFDSDFFNGLKFKINEDSIVNIEKIEIPKEGSNKAILSIEKGEMWASSSDARNAGEVIVKTKKTATDIGKSEVDFSAGEEEVIRVLKGKVETKILAVSEEGSQEIASLDIGISQKVSVDQKLIDILTVKKDYDPLEGIDEDFETSDWYAWNKGIKNKTVASDRKNDKEKSTSENTEEKEKESSNEIPETILISSPKSGSSFNESKFSVSGTYNPEKVKKVFVGEKEASLNSSKNTWIASGVELQKEGENSIPVFFENKNDEKTDYKNLTITLDKTPPEAPKVTSPENEETITESVQIIEGTASSDTVKVEVNNYILQKYKPGEKTWQYVASTQWGNLKTGENIYEIYAIDEAGNKSEKIEFKITYKAEEEKEVEENTSETNTDKTSNAPEENTTKKEDKASDKTENNKEENSEINEKTTEEKEEPNNETNSESEESSTATTTEEKSDLALTAPTVTTNYGKTLATTENKVLITGTCDKSSTKLVVNGYTLTKFEAGKESWSYYAASEYGTLNEGENTYQIYSEDENGNKSPVTTFKIIKQ